MFENVQRKLKNLETSVLAESDKYVDKFEALSISSVDIDEQQNPPSSLPDLRRLKLLSTDLNYVLTEAYIEQQSLLSNTRTELSDCSSTWNSMKTNKESEIKFMESQLKHQLKHLYDQIVLMIDFKATTLQSVQKIFDSYSKYLISTGQANGVLQASKKVSIVTTPYFLPLLGNRFFLTEEEESILATVRSIWAGAFLKSTSHTLLAERQLSTKHFNRHAQSTQWRFHIKLGCTAVLLLWAFSECINNEISERDVWNDQTFLIFVCLGDLLLLLFMWGVSMHVWRWAGIDFIRLLQLEDTELAGIAHPEESVYSSISNIGILFLLAFILFNKAVRGGYFGNGNDLTFAHAIPACLVLFAGLRMLYPCHTRKVWLHMLWRVLAAPFYQINFRDGYIGDLLTSLVRVFIPMCFSVIYVAETVFAWLSNKMSMTTARSNKWLTEMFWYKFGLLPVLTLFPLWLRLLQCLRRSVESGQRWPHIGNALKYTSAIIVISYGIFQPEIRQNSVWVACFIFATLFQFSWDLTQDWGMIVISPPRHATATSASTGVAAVDCLLGTSFSFRQTRLLGPVSTYILVIVFNLILRFSWTLTLLPAPVPVGDTPSLYVSFMTHLGPMLAGAEIIRRMVWGFFRLEYEQLEALGRKKTDEILQTQDTTDLLSLDKMDVMSAMEVQAGDSFITGSVGSDELWTEADWLVWLPPYVGRWIDSSRVLSRFENYRTRVRFIEAVIFVSLVVYIVAVAAQPAFS